MKRKAVTLLVGALLYALIPAISAAQILLRGVGTGASGADYDPGGVWFWQEASAQFSGIANLNGGTNTGHGIIAYRRWGMYGVSNGAGGALVNPADGFRNSGIFGNIGTGSCSLEGCRGFTTNQDWAASAADNAMTYKMTVGGTGTDGSPPNPGGVMTKANTINGATWQSVVIFYDVAGGAFKFAVFIDGSLAATQADASPTGTLSVVDWNNSRGTAFNSLVRNSGLTSGAFMISDRIVDTTNALPSGCPATTANCQTVVDAYYKNSLPVNPGTTTTDCHAFRDSYAPGGSEVDYCNRISGSTNPNDFLTNHGTANAETLVDVVSGTPLSVGSGVTLFLSPYGQGREPTDVPYVTWTSRSDSTVSTSTTTSCTGINCESGVMGNFGGEIRTGDRMFIFWMDCHLSTTPSGTMPTISGSWTAVPSSTSTNPSPDATGTGRCNWGGWTRVAPGDIVATNHKWQTGNAVEDPPTITYTSTGVAPRNITFLMVNTRSSTGTVNIDTSDCQAINRSGGASADYAAPSVSTTASKTTLLTFMGFRNGNNPIVPKAGNNSQMLHTQAYNVANTPFWWVGSEKLTSSGSTGSRTMTTFGTPATTDRAYGCLVALANG